METCYDGFGTGGIDSRLVTSDDVSHNGVYEMGIIEDVQYPLYDTSESSWNSSSSENLGFDQQSVNSQQSVSVQSAFVAYRKADSNADVNSFKRGQILLKRCLTLLSKIDEKRKLARQISTPRAPPAAAAASKNKRLAAEHMIAERFRRKRFKQHFSNLYSLLPRNSKRNRDSILANSTSYLKELKLRVAELEQQSQILRASVSTDISIKDKSCSGLESHKQLFTSKSTIIYRSDEVTLEQSKEIPLLVNIKSTMQTAGLICPTSLLMKQLELLRKEQVEILSIHSNTKKFQFRSSILVTPKGQAWDISMWQNLGNIVRQCLF